ncbi:unnamed protein product, partial [Prorocentrum cordatum]
MTYADQTKFPSYTEGCGVPESDVGGLRKEARRTMAEFALELVDSTSCSTAWQASFLPVICAGSALLVFPVIPAIGRWWRRLNASNEGALYDSLCQQRKSNGLLSSYLPREGGAPLGRRSDLSASTFNHDWMSDSSSSSSDSSSGGGTETDSEDEEADGLGPTVLGKPIDDEAEVG